MTNARKISTLRSDMTNASRLSIPPVFILIIGGLKKKEIQYMPVSKLNQSLGAITDHRIEAHRLILDTATETIYLGFYHSDIVRVRITKKGAEERDFSYANKIF